MSSAKLVEEFEALKLGSISVTEYLAKFHKLACYASYLVDTPYKKNKKL